MPPTKRPPRAALPSQPNQSLIDGLACLQAVISRSQAIGSRELARQLDLDPTRANRLLKTLGALGLVQQNHRLKYGPGPRLHVLSAQALFGSGLLRHALSSLAALHELGHIVALGVLWRDQVCYLYHAHAHMRPDEGIGRMEIFPATQSAIGMPLLAAQSDADVKALYRGAETIPGYKSLGELMADIHQVRLNRYALVAQTNRPGVHSLGLSLGQPAYAGIALSGSIGASDVPRLLARLQTAAREISERVGAGDALA